ncbi:hypothetical protein L873DRAFT_1796583 [Choiromyces venosus 120613-1]|uniref:Uncharacterized protein n=1 Tax=Choiromyces venosus 120613-1 TaxID=1336337 RepID=A0A3N4IWG1_9PEZI|nr:hypothetical protein L873DRAFT_1796583 [Choiromyces venosus 120613-1]
MGRKSFSSFLIDFKAAEFLADPTPLASREVFWDPLNSSLQSSLRTFFRNKGTPVDAATVAELIPLCIQFDDICPISECHPNSWKPGDANTCQCTSGKSQADYTCPNKPSGMSLHCSCPSGWRGQCNNCLVKTSSINFIGEYSSSLPASTGNPTLGVFNIGEWEPTSYPSRLWIADISSTAIQTRKICPTCNNHTQRMGFKLFMVAIDALKHVRQEGQGEDARSRWCQTRGICADCLHPDQSPGSGLFVSFRNEHPDNADRKSSADYGPVAGTLTPQQGG